MHPVHEGGAGRGRGGAPREAGSWSWPGSSLGCCLVVCLSRLSALHTSTPPRSVQRLGHHLHTIATFLGALRTVQTKGRTMREVGQCSLLDSVIHYLALRTSAYRPPPSSSAEWLGHCPRTAKNKSNFHCFLKLSPVP